MQARVELVRFRIPALFFAIVFALAASLSLGAVLGYTLKPTAVTQGRTEIVYVQSQGTPSASGDACIWVNGKKAC